MSGHDSAPRSPVAMSPPHVFGVLDRSPSPRARVSTPSRLPSITHNQPLEFDDMGGPSRVTPKAAVFGFSPPKVGGTLPPPGLGTSPVAASILVTKAGAARPILSPQLVSSPTADIHFPFFPDPSAGSPRPSAVLPSSPRGPAGDFPPRSRRNSAAIVSISLSSRSRSRTPRGSTAVLPAGSGSGTPSKAPTPRAEAPSSLLAMGNGGAEAWAPGVEDMDEWNPAGGVLLDNDDADEPAEALSFDDDEYPNGRSWTEESEASHAADVLTPGMIFGEGLQFEGDTIEAAVGRVQVGDSTVEHGLPLRRDGSSMGAPRAAAASSTTPRVKKTYEVIRQLGSGSYAVVYLVRERGGRRREYALKCLSKHDLEEEQLETQLFEATIHLSLPIHKNLVTLHDTLQTRSWLFLLLELCPGEDLFYWLERSRDASPPAATTKLPNNIRGAMEITSSSLLSSSSIPFSSSQLFSNFPSSFTNSPSTFSGNGFGSGSFNASPASLLFAHHNGSSHLQSAVSSHAATPPTPSLLSAFSANTLLTQRRLRLIASMFSQMCEAVAVCHDAGVSHRDIKPENFICCDSVELEAEEDNRMLNPDGGPSPDFGPQAKRKVVVKLTDFGLATTEEESGDVECGSKPYMSYECRNNLGPTYRPAPADVWSLGIVLINMLFHRNPWKDPTEGDPNFDTFLVNPTLFFTSKFTGIGKEVATYIAEHVLCVEVEDRVSARELGQWIKSLPEMIAGRRALHALKMARLDTRAKQTAADKGLFVKSPVAQANNAVPKSNLASALSSTAPVPVPNAELPAVPASEQAPSLSSLPPPSELAQAIGGLSHPAPTPDLDRDEIRSATTIDDHPTPTDMSTLVSPEPTDSGENDDSEHRGDSDEREAEPDKTREADERSLSTHKRRKRGVRKGKAAQAALAAQASGQSQDERDAFLSELVAASEELARDLSKKTSGGFMQEEFPPLGTSPAQAAAARKSKWKDFLAMSKGNPQLEALAKRVQERDVGGWSAPAKLQQGVNNPQLSRIVYNKQTATSSGFSSQLSSVATASSSQTSSSNGGPEDDDWRRRPARITEDPEREASAEKAQTRPVGVRRATEDSSSRSRQAALAAAAIAGGMEGPMGSFGKPSQLGGRPPGIPAQLGARPPGVPAQLGARPPGVPAQLGARPANIPARPGRSSNAHGKLNSSHRDVSDERWAPPTSSVPVAIGVTVTKEAKPTLREVPSHNSAPSHNSSKLNSPASKTPTMSNPVPIPSPSSTLDLPSPSAPGKSTLPQASSVASLDTITASSPVTAHPPGESPNKPKLKGQIQSLAKMLGGLKAGKGKE